MGDSWAALLLVDDREVVEEVLLHRLGVVVVAKLLVVQRLPDGSAVKHGNERVVDVVD